MRDSGGQSSSRAALDMADEVSENRSNIAGYLDLETKLTERLLVNVAGRVERYSDFGSTADGKIAARFEPVKGFAIRGAAGTGFRAPSLAQSFFSATSTNFIIVNNVNTPFDVRTFPVNTQEAQILGAQPLRAEESVNLSAGVSVDLPAGLTVTADYYAVDIDDRIVLCPTALRIARPHRRRRRPLLHQCDRHRDPRSRP